MARPVVIDQGSYFMKVGIARDEAPKAVVLSSSLGASPIERSRITDWDAMEKMWRHLYDELKVKASEQPVLLTEACMGDKVAREKAAKILFEKFQVPVLFFAKSSVLSLYTYGQKTGLMLEIGDGLAQALAVSDGYPVPNTAVTAKLAGTDLTTYMKDAIKAKGVTVTDQEARMIKEKYCYLRQKDQAASVKECSLEDGRTVSLGEELTTCPEILFNPSIIGSKEPSVASLVVQAIEACPPELRSTLYNNIHLAGGSSLFAGMQERVAKEVKGLAPQNPDVNVKAVQHGIYYAWIGGSILGSLEVMQPKFITKAEYEKEGAAVIHRKTY